MTEMTELKPCPFCGGEAKIHVGVLHDWGVYCAECKASTAMYYGTSDEAIEAWNRRA